MQHSHTDTDAQIIIIRASLYDLRALVDLIDGKEVSNYRKEDLRKALVASVQAYGQSLKSEADFVQTYILPSITKEGFDK
jgi:hypothetical protein